MSLTRAAGFGPRLKGVTKGRSHLVSCVNGLQAEPDTWRSPEVLICFKPYPPYAHFRRPGR